MNIIACGECHFTFFSKLITPYLNVNNIRINVIDYNIGTGGVDYINSMLDFYDFDDDDIFIFGSSIQEKIKDPIKLKSALENLTKRIFSKYKNSKIIFTNAISNTTHPYFEKINKINEVKSEFSNNKNVFVYNFKGDSSDFDDISHFTKSSKERYIREIADFIKDNIDKLIRPKFENSFVELSHEYNFKENESVSILIDFKNSTYFKITTESYTEKGSETNLQQGKTATGFREYALKYKNCKNIKIDTDGGIVKRVLIENY